MSLRTYFPDSVVLTADQRAALEALEAFMTDSSACAFVLRGYAGTGKTFLMQGVAAWLRAQSRTVLFAAPTNRAAKVLQYRTGTDVFTLHRLLYAYDDGRYHLAPRPEAWGEAPVLVVDEASLLGDNTAESAELCFGSGKLLTDLFQFLQLDRYPDTRLVFVGDPAQLPPVGMGYSPALSEANLRRLGGQRAVRAAALTEVVRQQADNGIVALAHAMRGAIEGRDFQPRLPLDKSAEVRVANGPQLLEKYFERSAGKPSGRQIILAHSNEAIDAYNRAVRARYYPDRQDRLAEGELLLVTNNVSGLTPALTNGELVQVLRVGARETLEVRMERRPQFVPAECPFIRFTEREIIGTFHFRDAELGVRGLDGQPHVLQVKVLENWLLHDTQPPFPFVASFLLRRIAYDRFYAANRALYREDRERFNALRQEFVRTDPYANAVCARFGYAVTCHKAQGGEWDYVYVDMCIQKTRASADFYRWAYTAVTRARKRVYLRLNPHDPHAATAAPPPAALRGEKAPRRAHPRGGDHRYRSPLNPR